MLCETELIVLNGVRYSDHASIVTTYSEQFGSLAFKCIRTASRRRGRANAFFRPLSVLQLNFDYHPLREIQTPGESSILHVPLRPTMEVSANAVAHFSVELLTRVLRANSADPQLFRFLKQEIVGMEGLSAKGINSFHLRLMTGLLRHMGILPVCDGYRPGYVLDYGNGSFRPICHADKRAAGEAASLLVQFITTAHPEELPLTVAQRGHLLDLLLGYLTYHFPDVGTLRSPEILSQLF
ncbi:MAG: recombination protein O N-terminal domain-containing protein [Porphyromonas sp.]|nr:recombination protein O N-terminal domain-containing protein [Porphyromonas sp.]